MAPPMEDAVECRPVGAPRGLRHDLVIEAQTTKPLRSRAFRRTDGPPARTRCPPGLPRAPRGVCDPGPPHGGDWQAAPGLVQGAPCRRLLAAGAPDALWRGRRAVRE